MTARPIINGFALLGLLAFSWWMVLSAPGAFLGVLVCGWVLGGGVMVGRLKAEDGYEVRHEPCYDCPFTSADEDCPEDVREWFQEPTEKQDTRFPCHVDGFIRCPGAERGCAGWYESAIRMGVYS